MRDSAENQIEMVFIRHGETESNQRKSYLGWTDEPLSVEGREVIAQNRKKYPDADRQKRLYMAISPARS